MSDSITVQQIVDRIKKNGGGTTLHTGNAATLAAGIAVTYTPSLDVLRHAAKRGKNLVVSREGPFWARKPDALSGNPTYIYKREFIDKHALAILQLRDSGAAQEADRYLQALAEALGWGDYHLAGRAFAPDNVYFKLPDTSLEALAASVESRLKIRAARVIGDPRTRVSKIALTHGRMLVPALQKVLREPAVDAVIIGEPVEWEASPYFQDLIASGQKKGIVAIGLEASEEPGGKQTTAWLKSLVREVPVEWIPAGEPFSVLQ